MDNDFNYKNYFSTPGILESFLSNYNTPWEALFDLKTFIGEFKKNAHNLGFSEIKEDVFVGRNVTIDDTARIKDHAIIGHNSIIGHAAFIRGGNVICDDVNVGHATEVKHSIILSGTALAHLNYVGDSIIGSGCNISGGATLANWRFDRKPVTIRKGDERISTGNEKFGGIVGDGCFVGVSAVLNPGTVLGKECLVFPLVSVSGTHPASSKIK